MESVFTAMAISFVVGFVLSFLVENVPGFAPWWNGFKYKGLSVAGFGLLVTAAFVLLGYAGAPIEGVPSPFIWDGLWASIGVYGTYLISTQTAYQLQAGNIRRKQEAQHDEDVAS